MCSLFQLLYSTLLRGIVKSILHWYYGSSELERLAEAHDLPNYLWSLSRSRDERLSLLHTRLMNTPQLVTEDLFLAVVEVKGSTDLGAFRRHLVDMYAVYERVQWMKQDAVATARVTADEGNPEHISMTDVVWKSLRPYDDTPYYQRNWVLIGFQGLNPFTDFRGSGMLGLLNLLSISQTGLGQELYSLSQSPNYFFYAVTSIKVTFMLVKALQTHALDDSLYRLQGRIQFQRVFDFVFEDLTRRWVNAGLGIMEFERFASEYSGGLAETVLSVEAA
jgi:hypothetical protein